MDYLDQTAPLEHALESFLQTRLGEIPVRVWGDNSEVLQTAPVAVYCHAEKETAPELGRQILKAAVTVRTAATVDTDRKQLDGKCAAVEALLHTADLPLGTGCALSIDGWGAVSVTSDSFLVRSLNFRVFIHF